MVPAEADDIKKEYEILHNELVKYNPELLDKRRVLAITKSDMLDEELIEALSQDCRREFRMSYIFYHGTGYCRVERPFMERAE